MLVYNVDHEIAARVCFDKVMQKLEARNGDRRSRRPVGW